jgi:hypothetical protein
MARFDDAAPFFPVDPAVLSVELDLCIIQNMN